MRTKIVTIDEKNMDLSVLKEAGEIIKSGGLVAFPTETVYGLGGDAFNPESSKKIYAAKGRPSDNPLIVHIGRLEDLTAVAKDIPEVAYRIADKFWPGPLTMIFNKVDRLPKETTGGLETVAVRFPVNPVAKEFILLAGGFVAAPSANKSGRPSPTGAKYVIEDLDNEVDMIIAGSDSEIGLESTIIDLTSKTPMILRPGFITKEDLDSLIGSVEVDETIINSQSSITPKAPGMKYRHYAPKGDLTIVKGESPAVVEFINEKVREAKENGLRTGVIATSENSKNYFADSVKDIGSRTDEVAIARNLFRVLREFDDENIEIIYAEAFESSGISMATMNRLLKAAGHKEIQV